MEEWAFDVDRMRRGGATHVFSYIMSKWKIAWPLW